MESSVTSAKESWVSRMGMWSGLSNAAKIPNKVGIERYPLVSAIYRDDVMLLLYNHIEQNKMYYLWVSPFVICSLFFNSLNVFLSILFIFCVSYSLILLLFLFICNSFPLLFRKLTLLNMREIALSWKIIYKIFSLTTFSLLNAISLLCKQLNSFHCTCDDDKEAHLYLHMSQPSHHKELCFLKGLFTVFCPVFYSSPVPGYVCYLNS